ncbi:MAG: single-stranded DNA-binding protein [Bacteroidales bacterium]|nr:single-stranded DNA-binding protein [Anaerotignum sp.]MCI5678689.1 single-stranded DNA-binding protein [Bacteroidales bacterium]MDY3925952.1 single-stranded DNA-binding protein [Anaerotignum sp.]
MNKVILIGRLVRDPEVRYSQGAEPLAVARYTLAVDRPMKKNGEKEADFISCVAFGKLGEFAEKHLKKGMKIAIEGRLQVRSWDDKDGKKRWTTEVLISSHEFCEKKEESGATPAAEGQAAPAEGFYPVDEDIEDDGDLPF